MTPTRTLGKGALCISIDLEAAWGVWDNPAPGYLSKCLELERMIVDRILSIFDRYDVSATWAIVGHLLKKSEDKDAGELPAWYAPDMIEAIRAAKTEQEIGSHSFAHIYFSNNTREQAEADLAAARAIHELHGLEFTSFVFPRNMVDHLQLLARAGIKVFRGTDHGWYTAAPGHHPIGRILHLVDTMIPLAPAVVQPLVHPNGLVELPGSMLLMGRNGLRKLVHPAVLGLKAKRGLKAAAREKGVFHLWFHPTNFYYDTEGQLATLERIVGEAALLRRERQIDIRTMGSFATPDAPVGLATH